MHVLVATDHYPPHPSGHAVAVAWWVRALRDAGVTVTVVADGPPAADPDPRRPPRLPGPRFGDPLAVLAVRPRDVRRLAGDLRPDVVHAHGYGPVCAATSAAFPGAPSVTTVHQLPAGSGAPRLLGVQTALGGLLRRQLGRSAAVVVPSRTVRALVAPFAGGLEPDVVPTGVRPAFVAPARAPRAAGGRRPRVLYLGRTSADKGFGVVVRLMAHRPDAGWHVVGSGPLRPPAVARWDPWAPTEAVVAAVDAADVVLAPSRNETQGLVALEALARGTPVAAPRGTAQAEWLRDGVDAALYDRDDPDAVWAAVERAAALDRRAIRLPEPLAEAALVARLRAVYERVAGG